MKRSGKLIASNDDLIYDLLQNPLFKVEASGIVLTRVAKTGKVFVNPDTWREAGSRNSEDYVEINYKGKRLLRHRIIYAAFSSEQNKPALAKDLTVNHENGIRGDDRPENLTISPHGKNNEHRFRVLNKGAVIGNAKMTWDLVQQIRVDRKNGSTLSELSRKFGLSKSNVSSIVNNKTWVEGHNYSSGGKNI